MGGITNLPSDVQMHMQLYIYHVILYSYTTEYIYVASLKNVIISAVRSSIDEFENENL